MTFGSDVDVDVDAEEAGEVVVEKGATFKKFVCRALLLEQRIMSRFAQSEDCVGIKVVQLRYTVVRCFDEVLSIVVI